MVYFCVFCDKKSSLCTKNYYIIYNNIDIVTFYHINIYVSNFHKHNFTTSARHNSLQINQSTKKRTETISIEQLPSFLFKTFESGRQPFSLYLCRDISIHRWSTVGPSQELPSISHEILPLPPSKGVESPRNRRKEDGSVSKRRT